jgi:hypothetical protein
MKTIFSAVLATSLLLAVGYAQNPVKDTVDTATNVGHAAVRHAQEAIDTAPKPRMPEGDGRRVDVTMTEYHFEMPSTVRPGLTTFVIKNAGRKEHTFAIKGEGVDQKLSPNPKPGQIATLQVDLKPGTYTITCPVDFHTMRGMKTTLTVR